MRVGVGISNTFKKSQYTSNTQTEIQIFLIGTVKFSSWIYLFLVVLVFLALPRSDVQNCKKFFLLVCFQIILFFYCSQFTHIFVRIVKWSAPRVIMANVEEITIFDTFVLVKRKGSSVPVIVMREPLKLQSNLCSQLQAV